MARRRRCGHAWVYPRDVSVSATPDVRVPTEFRYWDKVGDRRVQVARRAWKAVWRFDPQPPETLVNAFAEAEFQPVEEFRR